MSSVVFLMCGLRTAVKSMRTGQLLFHAAPQHLIGRDEHNADDEGNGEGADQALAHARLLYLLRRAGTCRERDERRERQPSAVRTLGWPLETVVVKMAPAKTRRYLDWNTARHLGFETKNRPRLYISKENNNRKGKNGRGNYSLKTKTSPEYCNTTTGRKQSKCPDCGTKVMNEEISFHTCTLSNSIEIKRWSEFEMKNKWVFLFFLRCSFLTTVRKENPQNKVTSKTKSEWQQVSHIYFNSSFFPSVSHCSNFPFVVVLFLFSYQTFFIVLYSWPKGKNSCQWSCS